MTAKQKFHGLRLANNSTADNFHFERVPATPNPLTYGRIWFNETDKTFNFSSLDTGGAVTVNTFASQGEMVTAIQSLTTMIANEVSRATAAEQLEITTRQAAVDALNAALATETANRITGDSNEAQARLDGIAAEAQARTDAIAVAAATAANATATEAAARLAGDQALTTRADNIQAELDATQAGAGLGVDGSYTAKADANYIGQATSLKDATEKLDTALKAEETARTSADAAFASALANEAQLRADADTNLQNQITAWVNVQLTNNANADLEEKAARIAADAALQAELDRVEAAVGLDTDGNVLPITETHYLNSVTTVFGGAFALDAKLFEVETALGAEVTRAKAAEADLTAAIQAEAARAGGVEAGLQQELNTTQAGAGLETDGTYKAATDSNYLNEATTLKDADHKLDAALKAVSDRVGVVETTAIPQLQTQINAEVTRATAAEQAEAARAQGVEQGLQDQVTAEVARAKAAETQVATDLAAETTRAQGVEQSLQSQLNAVVAASGEGAAALKTELNANRYSYKSASAETSHVVQHNMNTEFFSVQLMINYGDGVWHNDLAPIEEIDKNSFQITLDEPAFIKVSGQNNAALA
jgi:hypothetical protein